MNTKLRVAIDRPGKWSLLVCRLRESCSRHDGHGGILRTAGNLVPTREEFSSAIGNSQGYLWSIWDTGITTADAELASLVLEDIGVDSTKTDPQDVRLQATEETNPSMR